MYASCVSCRTRRSACRRTTSARTSRRCCARSRRSASRVLVIDDNSPDGTGEIADRLAGGARLRLGAPPRAQGGPRPRVPRRLPARARRRRRATILEMDCDFSHDPADVPRLIAACEAGADLALGSRYVAGRRHGELGARAAHRLVGRLVLRAAPARRPHPRPDRRLQVLPPRACSRRSTSTRSSRRATRSRSRRPTARSRKGFRVVEVPIRFADRTEGTSKMSRAIVLEAVWKVPLAAPRRPGRTAVTALRCVAWTSSTQRRSTTAIAGGPSSSTSGRRGASRARRSSRSSRQLERARARSHARQHRRASRRSRRATTCSRSRR